MAAVSFGKMIGAGWLAYLITEYSVKTTVSYTPLSAFHVACVRNADYAKRAK